MSSQIDSTKPAPKIDPGWIHNRYSSLISRADAVTRIHYSVRYNVGILFFKNVLSKPTSRAAPSSITDDVHNNDYDDDNKDDNKNNDYAQRNCKLSLFLFLLTGSSHFPMYHFLLLDLWPFNTHPSNSFITGYSFLNQRPRAGFILGN